MPTITLRTDKRKNPDQYTYTPATLALVKANPYKVHFIDRTGKAARVAITSIKTWKTRSTVEIHLKYGLREFFTCSLPTPETESDELIILGEHIPEEQ